ncbi:hypothetical protein [Streptomyces sp. DH8]|uniref:hypothetical protein n=1 Tax=Streptomyces sp. DH8 TaxID=2857008 RepID=UPI001E4C39A7|nr:hypothetical protein [Streptomyces sp. DH8]
MNPDFLPAIGSSLRSLCGFLDRHDVDDQALAELAAEIERARAAVAGARAARRTSRCTQHPGSPYDPTVPNGCLFCGPAHRRPARPVPEGVDPAAVLQLLDEHGEAVAIQTYGPQAVARAAYLRGRSATTEQRYGAPPVPDTEGDH